MAQITQTNEPVSPGLHSYTPELGQKRPDAQIDASLGHYGGHYFLWTELELKGRGITDITEDHHNRKRYKVTRKAFEKLEESYSIAMASYLD